MWINRRTFNSISYRETSFVFSLPSPSYHQYIQMKIDKDNFCDRYNYEFKCNTAPVHVRYFKNVISQPHALYA